MKRRIDIIVLFLILLTGLSSTLLAQKERAHIRKGNALYAKKQYTDADVEYRKALEQKNESFEALYNLGNALYKEEKYTDAVKCYNALPERTTNKMLQANIYHNLGNAYLNLYLQNKNMPDTNRFLEKSISAYRQALKRNPNDNGTKYNLSYALRLRQQQQNKNRQNNKQNQKKQQNKNQNNKQKDKNKQSQNKRKESDKNKSKPSDNQQKKNKNDKQKNQSVQQKLSKKEAARILNALKNNEAKLQKKIRKQKGTRVKIEKDW